MLRLAEDRDIQSLVHLAKGYHKEIYPDYEFDRDRTVINITNIVHLDNSVLLVLEDDGRIVGCIGFVLTTPISGGPFGAAELFWFVDKEHRGGSTGVRMLVEAERYMESNYDIKYLEMTAMETSMPDKVQGFLERRGYTPSERHFRKVLN